MDVPVRDRLRVQKTKGSKRYLKPFFMRGNLSSTLQILLFLHQFLNHPFQLINLLLLVVYLCLL